MHSATPFCREYPNAYFIINTWKHIFIFNDGDAYPQYLLSSFCAVLFQPIVTKFSQASAPELLQNIQKLKMP